LKDRETIDGLVRDYTALVTESQAQEQKQARQIVELETRRDELQVKIKAYERNIIQLIETQAELGRQQKEQEHEKAEATNAALTAASTAASNAHAQKEAAAAAAAAKESAAVVEALQKQLLAKEEEIKRIMDNPAPVSPVRQEADPAMLAKLEAAEAEVERLKKELERTRKSLDQAIKAGEKLGKDNALLRSARQEEERAEAELREEVTELQAKLEAAYKGSKAELSQAQDRLVKLEGQLVREVEAARSAAAEEAKQGYQRLVDLANKEKMEAVELYTQENRKRKAIHNKLLEMQGNIRVLCRVRPILPVEVASGEGKDVTEIPTQEDIIITREDRSSGKSRAMFEFDRVFAPASTQAEVFEAVAPMVTSVMDGYSSCIFAYGQTGMCVMCDLCVEGMCVCA
jgi:kinesin family protein C2/C3